MLQIERKKHRLKDVKKLKPFELNNEFLLNKFTSKTPQNFSGLPDIISNYNGR